MIRISLQRYNRIYRFIQFSIFPKTFRSIVDSAVCLFLLLLFSWRTTKVAFFVFFYFCFTRFEKTVSIMILESLVMLFLDVLCSLLFSGNIDLIRLRLWLIITNSLMNLSLTFIFLSINLFCLNNIFKGIFMIFSSTLAIIL